MYKSLMNKKSQKQYMNFTLFATKKQKNELFNSHHFFFFFFFKC